MVSSFCSRAAHVCLLAALSFGLPRCAIAQQPASSQSQQPDSASGPTQGQAQEQPAKPLQLQNLPPDSHTLTPEEQAKLKQQQAIQAVQQLASLQARWGTPMSTPGLSAALVEAGRTKAADGGTEISYHVTGTGFTPGDSLSLIQWPLNTQAKTTMSGITLDPNGTVICPEKPLPPVPTLPGQTRPAAKGPDCKTVMQAGQPVTVTATAAKGEPVRVALVDDDRQKGAATTTVPFPLAGEDKGCRLQVMLGLKDASMVLIEATGFPPNSTLNLEMSSGGNTRQIHSPTTAEGRTVVVDLPGRQGQESGTATVRFTGIEHVPSLAEAKAPPPDPQCAPAVTFPWGKDSYKVE